MSEPGQRMPYKYVALAEEREERAAGIMAVHAARTAKEAHKSPEHFAALLARQARAFRRAADILDAEAVTFIARLDEMKKTSEPAS